MEHTNAVRAVAVAGLLILAGCAGSVPGGSQATDTAGATDGTGTVQFFLSDERNAIDQFEHLNVTVTKVGIHRVGDGATPVNTSSVTDAGAADTTPTPTGEADASDGDWVEHEANRTVDLTELQGANATEFGTFGAPNGTYDRVFVYVSEIDGTLEGGEQVDVKLPSNKLQLRKTFTVGDGEATQFVFDMTVFEAGGSGMYILKPVVGESGTSDDVEITERPDAAGGPDAEGEADADDRETDADERDADEGDTDEGDTDANERAADDGATDTAEATSTANTTETANTTDATGVTGTTVATDDSEPGETGQTATPDGIRTAGTQDSPSPVVVDRL